MLNCITIMGRLTRDPEMRSTASGTIVANFTLAVDRDYTGDNRERPTDFIDCVAWREHGEFVSKYFRKGQMAVVTGRLESSKWKDNDDKTRWNWFINANKVYFGESKRETSANAEPTEATPPKLMEIDESDGELPF